MKDQQELNRQYQSEFQKNNSDASSARHESLFTVGFDTAHLWRSSAAGLIVLALIVPFFVNSVINGNANGIVFGALATGFILFFLIPSIRAIYGRSNRKKVK